VRLGEHIELFRYCGWFLRAFKKGLIAEYQIKDPVELNSGINQNITRIEIY
jgi:hypothetical protein